MGVPHVARRAAVYLALSTVVVAQPLLQLYGSNLAVFTTARWDGAVIVWFALLVVLAPAAALLAGDLVLSRLVRGHGHVVHAALVFMACWALVSLLMRSVSVGPWPADAALTAAGGGLLTAAYTRSGALRSWVVWMSPLAIVVPVVFVTAASSIVWPSGAQASFARDINGVPRPTVDVVWVQLDEAPLFPLLDSRGHVNASRFPGFASLASVSTWYRNVLSASQRTAVAVPAMLTGHEPDYSRQPVARDHPDNLFALARGLMELDVSEEVTDFCHGGWCTPGQPVVRAPVVVERRTPFGSFVRDALVVLGHKVLPARLRDRLPAIDESWGGFGRTDEGAESAEIAQSNGTGSTGTFTETLFGKEASVARLRTMIERQAVGSVPTLRFAHIMLPHRPWVLAPDERKSGTPVPDTRSVSTIDRRRDAYQSFLNQYIALDSEIGRMVDTLSRSPRWSRTMLIVTADHGLTFVPGLSYRDRIKPEVTGSLEDIYRVPLFIRYPGQDTPVTDDCTASVLDIVATVQAVTGIPGVRSNKGSDLKGNCTARQSRTVTWIKGKAQLSTGVSALLDRVKYYDRWIDADGDVDDIYRSGRAGVLLDTRVPPDAQTDSASTWSLANGDEFRGVGTAPFSHVPTRAVGHVIPGRDMAKGEELLVAVDGVFVGEAPEVSRLKAGERGYFSASLMSRLIGPGDHEVSLWLATPQGGSFSLRRIAG